MNELKKSSKKILTDLFFTKILEEYKQNWKGRDEQNKLQWNETSLIMASEKKIVNV